MTHLAFSGSALDITAVYDPLKSSLINACLSQFATRNITKKKKMYLAVVVVNRKYTKIWL